MTSVALSRGIKHWLFQELQCFIVFPGGKRDLTSPKLILKISSVGSVIPLLLLKKGRLETVSLPAVSSCIIYEFKTLVLPSTSTPFQLLMIKTRIYYWKMNRAQIELSSFKGVTDNLSSSKGEVKS